jgi:hypothetical protein
MTRRPISSKIKAHTVLRYGEKAKPRTTMLDQAARSGLSVRELKSIDAGVLTLKPLEKFYFPDGKGGFREERVPPDFEDPWHAAMVRAFDHFKLDPEDPSSWRMLVSHFAYIFFWQPSRRRGAKVRWTNERDEKLYRAVCSLPPGLSDVQAAKKLANDKRSPFYMCGVRGLQSRIGKVRRRKKFEPGT